VRFLALYLALKGDKFTDPIDGKSFKTFLLWNAKKQCPITSTLSLERHRLLWLFLNEESDFLHPL
jgi:hypothetical protein